MIKSTTFKIIVIADNGSGIKLDSTIPRPEMLPVLRDNSGYLQTVALICGEEEREMLAHLFWRAGAVRVCSAGDMSALPEHGFQPHDGEFPLRRYSKYVT